MKYVGTRTDKFGKFSFEEAIFMPGYLPDGGLLIPEEVPQVSRSTLLEWFKLSYPELCKRIFPLFVGEDEIPLADLEDIVDRAMAKLKIPEVLRVAKLSNNLNIMELFHTKTLSFKDLSMVSLAQFMQYFLAKRKKNIILIVGTSGDTGSAAIEAVRGLDHIDLVLLVPECARLQKLSMFTAIDKNIHVFSVDGTCDDNDVVIKLVCTDVSFRDRHNLGTLNSINWGRVMGHISHFFFGYFNVCTSCDREVEVVIPTGGGGNMTAASIAKHMGLPLKIVCAVNSNDIVHRTLNNNDYSMGKVVQTLSPAIDIQLPYNWERVLWLYSGGDVNHVNDVMKRFEDEGHSSIDTKLWKKIRETMSSYAVDDSVVLSTMQRCWKEDAYSLCPHSAVAVSYYFNRLSNPRADLPPISLCVATASPAKFPEAMGAAHLATVPSEEVDRWLSLPTRVSRMDKGEDLHKVLRDRVIAITTAREAGNRGDLYEGGVIPL
ncbi:threonine synthase-like 2 [Diadema antillarum]|uniref:threonine synthase-like 2 n=1 Tax=Diadema antillarum TaxID=105358 RepID=UPI003A86C230